MKKLLLTILFFIWQKICEISKVLSYVVFTFACCYVFLYILGILFFLSSSLFKLDVFIFAPHPSLFKNLLLEKLIVSIPFIGVVPFTAFLLIFVLVMEGKKIIEHIINWIQDNWRLAKEKVDNNIRKRRRK